MFIKQLIKKQRPYLHLVQTHGLITLTMPIITTCIKLRKLYPTTLKHIRTYGPSIGTHRTDKWFKICETVQKIFYADTLSINNLHLIQTISAPETLSRVVWYVTNRGIRKFLAILKKLN